VAFCLIQKQVLTAVDSHIRIGGAKGSKLQVADCPIDGKIKNNCISGAMLLHMTPQSSGYLENVWAWVADHDLDMPEQTRIDVYVARGMPLCALLIPRGNNVACAYDR